MKKVLLILLVVGCRPKSHASSSDFKLGSQVEPPPALGGVKLGMTVDEARKANPNLVESEFPGMLEIRGTTDRKLLVHIDFDGKVSGVTVDLPEALKCIDEPQQAWGAPTGRYHDFTKSPPRPMWTGPAWEARLDFDSQICSVSFHARGDAEKSEKLLRDIEDMKQGG